jgi:hypothetical protein
MLTRCPGIPQWGCGLSSESSESHRRLVAQQLHKHVWQGRVYLRPWFGSAKGQDLFALSP